MIRFKTLTLRNFLQFGNNTTVVQLERPGTTLIVGEDLDNSSDGVGSNGVGKSTMINAIAYALYDKPISQFDKIDQLVNNINKKNMEVTLEFVGEDGTEYKVHRMRKMKTGAEGNRVHFYVNGEDKTRTPNGDTNIDIAKAVGMPYDLFVRIVVFDACADGFLSMKGPDQKKFIEELFGLTIITERAKKLKEKIKDTKSEFDAKEAKIEQLTKEHERHQTLIENAKKRVATWTVTNASTIERLFEQLEGIEGVDLEGEAVLHVQVAELKAKLQAFASTIAEKNRAAKTAEAAIKKVKSELVHLRDSKCPYCLQEFANTQAKIDELTAQETELLENIDRIYQETDAVTEQHKKTEQQWKDAYSLITTLNEK
jgi:DNA repair exonuclease SbcCD ATPase subunit